MTPWQRHVTTEMFQHWAGQHNATVDFCNSPPGAGDKPPSDHLDLTGLDRWFLAACGISAKEKP